MRRTRGWRKAAIVGLTVACGLGGAVASAHSGGRVRAHAAQAAGPATATPIKHLVVIFQENVSFDHYFGTYPNATNTSGQPFTQRRANDADAAGRTGSGRDTKGTAGRRAGIC